MVIRTSKTGNVGMSKPCIHCLLLMKELPLEKGYRICRVLFTDHSGEIQYTTLQRLLTESDFYVSSFYRNSHFKLQS